MITMVGPAPNLVEIHPLTGAIDKPGTTSILPLIVGSNHHLPWSAAPPTVKAIAE